MTQQTDEPDIPTIQALSVDVEDYFQVWAFSEVITRDDWDTYSLRVEQSTKQVLELFARYDATATFFTLGWVAERCPALIREIVDAGHELASHGYDHAKVFDLTPEAFRDDARQTKAILEDIAGVPVNGYRAAGFSIDKRTPWATAILADIGYTYSSSIHPIAHDHYASPDAPRFAHQPVANSPFTEIPVSTVDLWGRRVSCAGGGWFRAMPYALTRRLIRKLLSEDRQPAVFYFHPWEVDPDQPRIEGLSFKSRFRHYLHLAKMENKLGRLLSDFRWGRIDQVFQVEKLDRAA